jgi:large subunit ribosomal protein L3
MQALIGKKIGMTQVYDDKGTHVPVTVIQAGPCTVVQSKNGKTDGYDAVQIGFGDKKEKSASKANVGHCKKAGSSPKRFLREVKLDAGEEVKPGQEITVAIFEGVSYVDVIGVTKGRGFAGVVKRHKFYGGHAAHGSMMHRRSGAIGNRTWPGRVMKNKRMAGHMGNSSITVQNLRVVKVRAEDNVILVQGAVPGPTGGLLLVRKSIKKTAKKS